MAQQKASVRLYETLPRMVNGLSPVSLPRPPTVLTFYPSGLGKDEHVAKFGQSGTTYCRVSRKMLQQSIPSIRPVHISTHFNTTTEMLPISTEGMGSSAGGGVGMEGCRGGLTVLTLFQAEGNIETLLQKQQIKLNTAHTHTAVSLFPLLPSSPQSLSSHPFHWDTLRLRWAIHFQAVMLAWELIITLTPPPPNQKYNTHTRTHTMHARIYNPYLPYKCTYADMPAHLYIALYNITCVVCLGNTIHAQTHTLTAAMNPKQGKKGVGGWWQGMQDKISANLILPLTFQEETAHLDASEEQTERIQANLSPCKPAQNISLPPSLPLSLSLFRSLRKLEMMRLYYKQRGGVKSEVAESIRRLRCFWQTALRDCELVAHEGQRGWVGGLVENGCDAADGRKKKSVSEDILKP